VLIREAANAIQLYQILHNCKPQILILSNIKSFQNRVIENYCAMNKGQLIVHQLYYKNSIEDYSYIHIVNEEKLAFNKLKKFVIPKIQEESVKELIPIAVDTREFSGSLTPHLYKAGIRMIPLMLSVGDYVVSDEVCIERKAVNTGDLFESIRAGRL